MRAKEVYFRCLSNTDIGKCREENQDAILVRETVSGNEKVTVACVCDGVGGLERGSEASRTAVNKLEEWIDCELPYLVSDTETIEKRLRLLVGEINSDLYYRNIRLGSGSGTTFSAILLGEDHFTVCHAGDSRIYRISEKAEQITEDHSWIARQVKSGNMTEDATARDKRKNVILKCLGVSQSIMPDVFSGFWTAPVSFLLCTDGFWHCLSEGELTEDFAPGFSSDRTVLERLTGVVKSRGEADNISVVAIDIPGDDEIGTLKLD